jgi:phosphoglycerate dehydrogenase-like enzyme
MAEPVLSPKKLPDGTHAVIVVLATVHLPMPEVDTAPLTHEVLAYKHTTPQEAPERVKDASVIVTTSTPITKELIEGAPHL